MLRQSISTTEEKLNFGKYAGKTVKAIIDLNTGYILWLAEEGIVDFSQDVLDLAHAEYANNSPPEEYFWTPDH